MPGVDIKVARKSIAEGFAEATGLDRVRRLKRLTSSHSHACWVVYAGGEKYLLKVNVRRASPSEFAQEIEAHRLVNARRIPAPELVAACAVPNSLGRPFSVQRWLRGQDGDSAVHKLSEGRRARFASEFGRTVALMHQIRGAWFSEDVLGEKRFPSWKRLCASRLKGLTASNREAAVLPAALLDAVVGRCRGLLEELPADIAPAFTHRDLYLPNTVAFYGRFRALLDFESARFYDPLWDFVKLDAWVFRRHPRLLAPFLEGYRDVVPWRPDFNRRIFLYQALEYLAAFPYFGVASPNARMLHDFGHLLGEWHAHRPASWPWEEAASR